MMAWSAWQVRLGTPGCGLVGDTLAQALLYHAHQAVLR
jgi:hypothetical protein